MGQKDWKRFFREIKEKKDRWLILLLVGILLIIIALPVSDRKKNSNAGDRETASEEEYGSIGGLTDDSYTRRLEIRLEEALHQVKGVGNVSVMITLSSSSEKVVRSRIFAFGCLDKILRDASRPSIFSIRISIRSTSGSYLS